MTLNFPNKTDAESLANFHRIIRRDGDARFLPDVEKCRDAARNLYEKISSVKCGQPRFVMPCEEWLVDNYHIVGE